MIELKVLVCGDRDWNDSNEGYIIKSFIESLPKGTILIEGEARGADRTSRECAEKCGFTDDQILKFPANWSAFSKFAGPIRNGEMLAKGKPTHVIAYHRNLINSKGTRNMVERSLLNGVPVFVNIDSWTDVELGIGQIFKVD